MASAALGLYYTDHDQMLVIYASSSETSLYHGQILLESIQETSNENGAILDLAQSEPKRWLEISFVQREAHI